MRQYSQNKITNPEVVNMEQRLGVYGAERLDLNTRSKRQRRSKGQTSEDKVERDDKTCEEVFKFIVWTDISTMI